MSSPIALQELFKAGFEDFAIPSYETAPFTTIQNRAQVTRSLKAIAGVERVHVKGLNRLQNEFGPNGEQVFEAENKDARVRFIGSGWIVKSLGSGTGEGTFVQTATAEDYMEVTFYGTGLTMLMILPNAARDLRVTVDGGAEGSTILPAAFSATLYNRGTGINQPIVLTSGLTLGWHTVKIRNATALSQNIYGFEILNERSNLAVYAGAGISNGSFNGLSALATSAFNQGVVGTRGARVVKYIENGTLKSAVQEVDSTAKYMSLADHTNEEVVRRVNFREFGANRADDFSTLSTTSARVFTLDDGVTSLSLDSGTADDATGMAATATSNFMMITFVGTGLDVFSGVVATATSQIFIDGVSVASSALYFNTTNVWKICSGLPYGTHTVKITNTSNATSPRIKDFIIYQPKKPSIPSGSIQVADYNVMADFSPSTANTNGYIGAGVIRKFPVREFVYSGSWTAPTINGAFAWNQSSYNIGAATAGSYCSYVFWGTGFEFKICNTASANNSVISVDGSSNLSAYTTSLLQTSTGATFTAATGTIAGTNAATNAISVRVSGLSLGLHTVKITHNSVGTAYQDVIDIITPIHINNPTLKVGSQSLKSVTKYSPEKVAVNAGPDLSKAKAWVVFDPVNAKILSSYNVSSVLTASTGLFIVFFEKQFKNVNYGHSGAVQNSSRYVCGDATASGFKNTGFFRVIVQSDDSVLRSDSIFAVSFFGELADE